MKAIKLLCGLVDLLAELFDNCFRFRGLLTQLRSFLLKSFGLLFVFFHTSQEVNTFLVQLPPPKV